MNITFVLSHTPDPRMNKRINLLKEKYRVSLIFWNRTKADIWNFVHKDIEYMEISTNTVFTNPLKRIISTFRFTLKAIRFLSEKRPGIIYTENIDMLMVCSIYSLLSKVRPKIIYEIADLHRLIIDNPNNPVEKLLRKILVFLEKRLRNNVNLLVLTSNKFYDIYFKDYYTKDDVIFMPNMPDLYPFSSYKPKSGGSFTVGFIGAVRYKEQMKMLIYAAEKCGIRVLFAGAGFDNEIENICKDMDFIEYYGKYDYDLEIAKLYGKIDCVFSVYDADMNNVKVALPNKLYEAIYCEIPIIVAKGTYLAELVEEMGVGIAVSHTDVAGLEKALKKLATDIEYYNSLVKACKEHKSEIDMSIYNEQLLNRIERII